MNSDGLNLALVGPRTRKLARIRARAGGFAQRPLTI
jgi:hypothetical protein